MKTVIEMAREAGLHRQQHNLMSNPVQYRFSYDGYEEELEAFAELVREEAQAEEREAIIQEIPGGFSVDPQWVCDMIRARGQA